MATSSDLIGNRARHLTAFIIAPQPTALGLVLVRIKHLRYLGFHKYVHSYTKSKNIPVMSRKLQFFVTLRVSMTRGFGLDTGFIHYDDL
jgi:hypothetical protein